MSEETKVTTEETKETPAKKKFFTEARIELITAIFLGLTALFTAWAGWIGSLHGGNQSTHYTESNNLTSEGNASWNEASQSMIQDMMTWNTISDLIIEETFASEHGDQDAVDKYDWKIEQIITDNCSPEFAGAVSWAMEQLMETGENVSPFEMEGFVESYYEDARATLAEAEELLEQGKIDNMHGDTYNFCTVIYSVVLFLLGVVGLFKHMPNRTVVLCIAVIGCIATTIFMFTVPMPIDSIMSAITGA